MNRARNQSLTFSQAKRTGAVASPNLRSAAAGFPIVSDDDTKSNRSSTNWKARPRFLPYWKAVSTSGASAPDIVAACEWKRSHQPTNQDHRVNCYLQLSDCSRSAMLFFCRSLWSSAKISRFQFLLHPAAWILLVLSRSRPAKEHEKWKNWMRRHNKFSPIRVHKTLRNKFEDLLTNVQWLN